MAAALSHRKRWLRLLSAFRRVLTSIGAPLGPSVSLGEAGLGTLGSWGIVAPTAWPAGALS